MKARLSCHSYLFHCYLHMWFVCSGACSSYKYTDVSAISLHQKDGFRDHIFHSKLIYPQVNWYRYHNPTVKKSIALVPEYFYFPYHFVDLPEGKPQFCWTRHHFGRLNPQGLILTTIFKWLSPLLPAKSWSCGLNLHFFLVKSQIVILKPPFLSILS